MRKDVLDQAGGLIAFAQYIAEDYFMAKAIADRWAALRSAPERAGRNADTARVSAMRGDGTGRGVGKRDREGELIFLDRSPSLSPPPLQVSAQNIPVRLP